MIVVGVIRGGGSATLIGRVVRVTMETRKIVKTLPALNERVGEAGAVVQQ